MKVHSISRKIANFSLVTAALMTGVLTNSCSYVTNRFTPEEIEYDEDMSNKTSW